MKKAVWHNVRITPEVCKYCDTNYVRKDRI